MQGTLMSSDFVGPAKGMSVMDFYNKCASSDTLWSMQGLIFLDCGIIP